MSPIRQGKCFFCIYFLAEAVAAAELDPTFGETPPIARISFDKGGANDDVPTAIAIDEDGQLLVSGSVENAAGKENIGVAALDAEGHLDAITTIESASYQTFSHDVIPVAGGICTVGSRNAIDASVSCWSDLATPQQFNIALDVDRWVSASPATTGDFPGVFYVLGEGVKAGGTDLGFFIRRFVRGFDGSVIWDQTFAQGDSQITHHVPGYSIPPVEITSDDDLRVLVNVTNNGGLYVIRYSADGTQLWLIEFFSGSGDVTGKALATRNQRSIAAYEVNQPGALQYPARMMAIDSTGAFDLTFDLPDDSYSPGFVSLPFATDENIVVEHALDVAIDAFDRIYALGNYVSADGQLHSVVVRLLPNGAPDESWGPEGRFELPAAYRRSVAMVLQQELPVIAFTFDDGSISGRDFGVVRIRESAIFYDGFE